MSYTIPHYYPKYEILWDDDYLANSPFNATYMYNDHYVYCFLTCFPQAVRRSQWALLLDVAGTQPDGDSQVCVCVCVW